MPGNVDFLPVLHHECQVQPINVGVRHGTACSSNGVINPTALLQPDDSRLGDGSGHVDHQQPRRCGLALPTIWTRGRSRSTVRCGPFTWRRGVSTGTGPAKGQDLRDGGTRLPPKPDPGHHRQCTQQRGDAGPHPPPERRGPTGTTPAFSSGGIAGTAVLKTVKAVLQKPGA
ncbi:hypothetical protein GCM10007170_10940 [Arthrobacter liuii]|uniref:Uncharacterized protein n=1 Tax=Arthrobacter liuii TaxID=1476996 RepID=A0ABQ2ANH9_9MICC|nr:hypothetical protein GCM10007170_10940 [Arthrobacter liuii]